MKYYKIIFKDGEEWNCYTEDNREYNSHGIMWSSSLTKQNIPVLEPLETMIEPSNVDRIEEIEPKEYWEGIEYMVNKEYDEEIEVLLQEVEDLNEARKGLLEQIEGKW